jgi:hypothetical protein
METNAQLPFVKKKASTFMVAVDGSHSAHQAFHFALQHSAKDDHIIVVTGKSSFVACSSNILIGVRKKYPSITPEITNDPNKLAQEKERIKDINAKQTEKGEEILKTYQNLCQQAAVTKLFLLISQFSDNAHSPKSSTEVLEALAFWPKKSAKLLKIPKWMD